MLEVGLCLVPRHVCGVCWIYDILVGSFLEGGRSIGLEDGSDSSSGKRRNVDIVIDSLYEGTEV